jgi:hypothetical protein
MIYPLILPVTLYTGMKGKSSSAQKDFVMSRDGDPALAVSINMDKTRLWKSFLSAHQDNTVFPVAFGAEHRHVGMRE